MRPDRSLLLVRPMSPVASILPPWYHTVEGRKLGKLRSSGRATYCTEVRIVDPEGQEVPRGPNVMQGYWNKPELTAAALQDGWTHTGNGGKMDEDGFNLGSRPYQGHDQDLWGGRLFRRSRKRTGAASGRVGQRRHRHSQRAVGRSGACGSRAEAGA